MKIHIAIFVVIVAVTSITFAQNHPIQPQQPKISLFESVEIIKEYMKKKTKHDYSDRNLTSVTLHYFDSHPRKGEAWVYSFSHRVPTLGNDLSIFHFTDGEIIEFHHGP